MKYHVQLSSRADRDVELALRWFDDQHATAVGNRWLAQLTAKLDTLETMPRRCPLAAEAAGLNLELRELLFGRRRAKYRILFIIDEEFVHILHIRFAAQDAVSKEELQT